MNSSKNVPVLKPILVTGSHRSGTTWIGKIISASPSIAYIHEPFNPDISKIFPGICSAKFYYWYQYITDDNESNYWQQIQNTLDFNYDLSNQIALNQNFGDYKRTVQEYLRFIKHRLNNSIPLIKDPFALFSAEWLARKFDMNVVITIRHPAAFISSLKRLNWNYDFSHFLQQPLLMRDHLQSFETEIFEYSQKKVDPIDQASLIWKIIYHTVNKYISKYPNWIYLRYEEMAIDPLNNFEQLFKQLNLEFSDHIKTTVQNHCQVSNSAKTLEGEYYLVKIDSKTNISNWKNCLTDSEITYIRNQVEAISHNFYSDSDW